MCLNNGRYIVPAVFLKSFCLSAVLSAVSGLRVKVKDLHEGRCGSGFYIIANNVEEMWVACV